jgi:alpha-galactosidase
MPVENIKLSYLDAAGTMRSLDLVVPTGQREFSITSEHLAITSHIEHALGGSIIRTSITNISVDAIRLVNLTIEVSTGIPAGSSARFFKHGYQSWSGSGAVEVGGPRTHRRDDASQIARVNHQSEAHRPPEFPEAHTSELFTIVEAAHSPHRVMVGFIGAATALTTVTVSSPERAIARVILDGLALASGSRREIEPLLVIESSESASNLAARWADAIGRRMDARIGAPHQRGWCSWYHYFHDITEDALRANLKSLESMRAQFPVDVVQLDDGFQSALGDWDTTNQKFPSGLKKIAAEIHAAGFKPGIWTAPFLAARDSRLMSHHPDWFIVHEDAGQPMRAGYNPKWTQSDDHYAYALDPSNAAVRAHLERLFAKLVHDFRYSYLKLDFLYAAAADGRRHDPNWTRGETLRRGLEAIRAGAGDDAFILGCGCPLGQAIGIVDGMRVGPDVAPFWGSTASGAGDPSTVYALDAIVARSFMHRKLWLNDPDCLMLRARETKLNSDERAALAATIAASGGMLLISDDMALLETEAAELFRTVARISREIDSDAAHEPVLPIDLMGIGDVRGLIKKTAHGKIAMLLNRGDSATRIRTADFALDGTDVIAIDFAGDESAVFDEITLPPHSARIIRATG